jgi:hypothetical protein
MNQLADDENLAAGRAGESGVVAQ